MNPALLLDPKGSRKRGKFIISPTFSPSLPSNTSSQSIPSSKADEEMANQPEESILVSQPLYHAQSSTTSNPVYETSQHEMTSLDHLVSNSYPDAPPQNVAEYNDSESGPELIESADAGSQSRDNRVVPQLQPAFDPRALLNPKAASKRPASDVGSERGRDDALEGGQISLVERLHNVHERTASPSKRVKTENEHKKQQPRSNFSGSGALDLKSQNGQPSPQAGSSAPVDLTMSNYVSPFWKI